MLHPHTISIILQSCRAELHRFLAPCGFLAKDISMNPLPNDGLTFDTDPGLPITFDLRDQAGQQIGHYLSVRDPTPLRRGAVRCSLPNRQGPRLQRILLPVCRMPNPTEAQFSSMRIRRNVRRLVTTPDRAARSVLDPRHHSTPGATIVSNHKIFLRNSTNTVKNIYRLSLGHAIRWKVVIINRKALTIGG